MLRFPKVTIQICLLLSVFLPYKIQSQMLAYEVCFSTIDIKPNYIYDCTHGFKYPSNNRHVYEKLIKAVQNTNLILKAYKDGLITLIDLKLNTQFCKDVIFICAFHMKNESPSAKLRFYPLLVSPII